MGKRVRGIVSNKQTQAQIARQEIVAKLYKRGFTESQIKIAVMEQLCLKTYSSQTVHADVVAIKNMWRAEVLDDMDTAMRIELVRIDDALKELWEAWEKSKTDYKAKKHKQKGVLVDGEGKSSVKLAGTREVEQQESEEICFGDPRYLAEIRQQLIERRKILGLYKPEKKELSGVDGSALLPANLLDLSTVPENKLRELLNIIKS